MKIIKKLSEDEFIIKLGPEDADNTRQIVLAHDYLQFSGRDWNCTDLHGLDSPYGFGNVVYNHARIQIPIRMAQDILEHVLTKDRKYLKKEHLVRENGEKAYCDSIGLSYRYAKDDGTRMIAIYSEEKDEYIHIPSDICNTIYKIAKEQ